MTLWCLRQSRTPLSRLVAPPCSQCSTWWPSHHDGGNPSRTLTEQTYNRLRHAIVEGQLAPGTKLRIEHLRHQLRTHPCHHCPDRETHARFVERAMRLEREVDQASRKAEARYQFIQDNALDAEVDV